MYIGTYDLGAIHHIINTSNVVHVSFAADPNDPFPAILPMIGQMGSYKYPSSSLDDPMECYLHGYVSSRVMNLARREGKSEGLPVVRDLCWRTVVASNSRISHTTEASFLSCSVVPTFFCHAAINPYPPRSTYPLIKTSRVYRLVHIRHTHRRPRPQSDS